MVRFNEKLGTKTILGGIKYEENALENFAYGYRPVFWAVSFQSSGVVQVLGLAGMVDSARMFFRTRFHSDARLFIRTDDF
jgi:hypothetical protein